VAVAPSAYHQLADDGAEVASAKGARNAGSLFVLSSRSSRRIEEVGEHAGPWWMQIYVWQDRSVTADFAQRAASAGAQALVLTVDTPIVGAKYAAALPPVTDDDVLANAPGADPAKVEQDPSVGIEAIEWLRSVSGLSVVVKGVLRGDEARRLVDAGAAGVIVSNHGGRQLDRAVPTAVALPEVVAAVGDEVEVYVDGGVRSGVDVLTAIGLGARLVFLGRPVLWGLTVGGAGGVTETIGALSAELLHAMSVAGYTSPAEVRADGSFAVRI
jgi:4-hydroxymandelate oxidase